LTTRLPALAAHAARPERIVYLTQARLPTEKANGYQICQMCAALAGSGRDVLLLHPRRTQSDPALRGQTVFAYYGLPEMFTVKQLANADIIPLLVRLGAERLKAVFIGHSLIWGLYAALVARQAGASLYYTRDIAVALWLSRIGLPLVFEAHGLPRGFQRHLLRAFLGRPNLIVAAGLTSYIRDGLVELGCPKERAVVAPDAVALDRFSGLPNRGACRAALGLPAERPIVGYIGRFETMGMEKGIAELVQAIGAVPRVGGVDPLLLCVGGPLGNVPAYLALAERHGVPPERLKFVDRVPAAQVPLWIRACDVATIPWPRNDFSAYYTSPMKLFEYMAAGTAIIASDLPSLREVLRHDQNAWLIAPGDAMVLAAAITRLLHDRPLSERLATRARIDVQQHTWESRAAHILNHRAPH
jgi:glycosyltransferase involved in cell wall biosynthesis